MLKVICFLGTSTIVSTLSASLFLKLFSCLSYFSTWSSWCLSNGSCIMPLMIVSIISIHQLKSIWVLFVIAAALITYGTRCAPSILITFINMVLNKPTPFEDKCLTPYMYAGQGGIQTFLFICAIICVPWMLLAKPLMIARARKAAALHSVSSLYCKITKNFHVSQLCHLFKYFEIFLIYLV